MDELARNLLTALDGADVAGMHVTLLPDFSLDHFISMPPFADSCPELERLQQQGGGGMRVARQALKPGGNATNCASALARLGAQAHLIARTNAFGAFFLRGTIGREGVHLERVRDDGELTMTTALEFPDGNVMLQTPGAALTDFGPDRLDAADWDLISRSDAVFTCNWINQLATDLAQAVNRAARRHGACTFIDTGDPRADHVDLPALMERVILSPDLDVLSVNNVELRHYPLPGDEGHATSVAHGRALSARMTGRVDEHAKDFSATFEQGRLAAIVPTFDVQARQCTGAGDTWTAGNILGQLLGLPPEQRLLLANATAAAYVTSPDMRHPTLAAVRDVLATVPLKPIPPRVAQATSAQTPAI